MGILYVLVFHTVRVWWLLLILSYFAFILIIITIYLCRTRYDFIWRIWMVQWHCHHRAKCLLIPNANWTSAGHWVGRWKKLIRLLVNFRYARCTMHAHIYSIFRFSVQQISILWINTQTNICALYNRSVNTLRIYRKRQTFQTFAKFICVFMTIAAIDGTTNQPSIEMIFIRLLTRSSSSGERS